MIIHNKNNKIKNVYVICMKFDLTHKPLRNDSLYFCSKIIIAKR